MDSHSDSALPNGFHPNGLLLKGAASVTRPLDPKRWAAAEGRTAELISRIQPNWTSEKHRNAVASYVQRLIGQCVPCQVFTFGSVPLRTYLPDGDIDLTAFSEDHNVKDNWANSVLDMLKREEMNEHAEFHVKEVNYIQAEVKIIKCLVDNIVVDISFNQLGGLCTLCFLEEVDNLISQNHLFKRSIILIKAWCYYESRILGAHHGLISTYALETLVLYIFHVFNNSFAGPLEVLYRFLEFFSKFDWANFCVSLWGPVPICSLPRMEADPPRKDGAELLLDKMFLNACSTAYSVFPGSQDNQEQPFKSKHFNVVDPLRINNNLGRSVSKGNFFRIRSAFTFGAQKLVRILECQEENVVAEVNQFFVNTWERHGKGYRPDTPLVDLCHLGQADPKHEANCRRSTLSEIPTENFANQNRQIDESHNSMQPGNFPVNQTAGAINVYNLHYPRQKDHKDESTTQLSSARDQYFIQRENSTKKQQSEKGRTSREKFWQTRRHTIPQFARSSSSPELTSISSEAVSLHRHNEASGWVKEVTTTRTECNRITRDFGMDSHLEKCFTDDLSSSESLTHLSRCNPESSHPLGRYSSKPVSGSSKSVTSSGDESSLRHQQGQGFMNMHMLNLASHPFVSVSPSIPGSRPQSYSSDPLLAPYQQNNHAGSTAEVEIVDGLHGEALSIEDDNLDDHHGFWADSNADSITNIDHESEDFTTARSRLSPASPANFYGTKGSSETSWNGNSSKMNYAVRYPMTRISSSSKKPTRVVDKRQLDGEPVCRIYDGVNDGSAIPSVTSLHGEVHQLPGFGQAHMRYPNSVLPFAPLLVRPGSQQGMSNNHAVLPVAFYPAGPPVPFVTMVPVYNVNAETGASGSPVSHEDIEMDKPTVPMGQSSHSSDPTEELKQLSHSDSLGSTERTTSIEQSDESGPDIFNSDFASHWKNLQYGRLCQNSQLPHPFANPPSVLVPPSHLQGNVPFDASRSPYSRSSNFFAPLVPVTTPQPGPSKTTSVSRQYGREFPKHRNGTGTYFPNPEVIRDRQFVTSRQYQVDPKHDRNDYQGEREANWNFSWKPRFSGRAHPRYRSDKRNSKIDRSVASSSQTDGGCNTFRKNPRQLDQIPKDPSIPRSTWNKHYYDGDSSVHQTPSDYCDEVSQSKDAQPELYMLYPYPHNIAYGSSNESLHFGSVGPKPLIGTDTVEVRRGYTEGCDLDHQSYQGDTEPPSRDYASPPRFLR